MPDWTVELSKPIAQGQAWTKSVTVEQCPYNLALVKGLDDLFKWCAEEGKDAEDYPVPQAAVDYWYQCRASGSMQLYEIQSELDVRWGLSFVMKPVEDAAPPPSKPKPKARVETEAPTKSQSLHDLLRDRMSDLRNREKQLVSQLQRVQDEYEEVRDDLRDTNNLLLALGTKKSKRKKANAEG